MKNTLKYQPQDPKIFASQEKLYKLIEQKLSSHTPKYFVYKETESVDAAVLIPLYFKNDQPHILFTKRTQHVEHHKGQISFPGGKMDGTDIDIKYTALRETEEEVGILKDDINIIGQTDYFLTNTHYMVTPFVGTFDYPYPFNVNDQEIDHLIEVPLVRLLDDEIFEVKPYSKNGQTWKVHFYRFEDEIIWGVTGFLLSNFLSIVFDMPRNIVDSL